MIGNLEMVCKVIRIVGVNALCLTYLVPVALAMFST